MSDETFAARVGRAREHIARGELERVVLARTFRTPPRNADPFDVYRALRLLSPRPFLFFLDFVETPMVPAQLILGASEEALIGPGAATGGSAGERIRAVVFGMARMTFHPTPVHLVRAGGGFKSNPQVLVLYRFLVGGFPTIPLPANDPLGEAVFQRPKKDVDEFPTKEDHVSVLGEHEQPDVPEIRIDEIQR